MFVPRHAEPTITGLLRSYSLVAVTGPRQSGKTTPVRALLPDWPYVSRESLDLLEYATHDPRGFLG